MTIRTFFCLLAGLAAPLARADTAYSLPGVTHVAQDLYEVMGGDTFVRTRYCYNMSMGPATLIIEQPAGYTVGRIVFQDKQSCEVAMVLVKARL